VSSVTTLAATAGEVALGEWVHVAAVYDGNGMRLYHDGIEVGSVAVRGELVVNWSVSAAIGNQPAGAGDAPFHGSIDDVRIYDRALTPLEIKALASGAGG
jgi:hypothetical protein